jgi:(p)ppGpp synthase/HD superfamily hydrolase
MALAGVFCYHMHMEYYTNLETYEDLQAHKLAVLSNIGQKDKVLVEKAIELVEKHHNTPRTLYAGNYNRHPVRVARVLIEEFGVKNINAVLVALCHDLSEWTSYDVNGLEEEFGMEVKNGVEALTWNQNDTWEKFFQKIVATGNNDLIKVKMADKLDNNRAAVFSNNLEEKKKARDKTELILRPFIEKHFPEYWDKFENSLLALT